MWPTTPLAAKNRKMAKPMIRTPPARSKKSHSSDGSEFANLHPHLKYQHARGQNKWNKPVARKIKGTMLTCHGIPLRLKKCHCLDGAAPLPITTRFVAEEALHAAKNAKPIAMSFVFNLLQIVNPTTGRFSGSCHSAGSSVLPSDRSPHLSPLISSKPALVPKVFQTSHPSTLPIPAAIG